MTRRSHLHAALLATTVLASVPAVADDEHIAIELNRTEDVESGCRLSLVFSNGMPVAVDRLTIEAVAFDQEGRVDRFVLLKARPMPAGKTRVQQFDLAGTPCSRIGRLLLNDITECAGEELSPAGCLAAIRATSKTDVPFSPALPPGADVPNGG